MVALAVKPYPYFKMSTVEIEAEETSYTYLCLLYTSLMVLMAEKDITWEEITQELSQRK